MKTKRVRNRCRSGLNITVGPRAWGRFRGMLITARWALGTSVFNDDLVNMALDLLAEELPPHGVRPGPDHKLRRLARKYVRETI